MEFKAGEFLFFEFPGRGKYVVRTSSGGNTNDGVVPFDHYFFMQIMPSQQGTVSTLLIPMTDVVGLQKNGFMSLKKEGDYFFGTVETTSSLYADLVHKTSGITMAK